MTVGIDLRGPLAHGEVRSKTELMTHGPVHEVKVDGTYQARGEEKRSKTGR